MFRCVNPPVLGNDAGNHHLVVLCTMNTNLLETQEQHNSNLASTSLLSHDVWAVHWQLGRCILNLADDCFGEPGVGMGRGAPRQELRGGKTGSGPGEEYSGKTN